LVVPVPAVFSKVPELLIAGVVPPLFWINPSFTMFHTAPAFTFNVAPFSIKNIAPPVLEPKVLVPAAFTVRVSKVGKAGGMLMPPLALVIPVPLIVAFDQVVRPVTVRVAVPVNVPPFRFRTDAVLVPLRVRVPLLIVRVVNVAEPLMVRGPPEKFMGAPVVNLLMV
jgi:hypothetical protein